MICITNLTGKNKPKMDISVGGKTLAPGSHMEFPDEIADIYGVIAAEKKGLLSIEMVKSVLTEAVVPVSEAVAEVNIEVEEAAPVVEENEAPVVSDNKGSKEKHKKGSK